MASSPPSQLRAKEALQQSPMPALRSLCVEETDTEVVISGCVGTYYLKQLAQETILPVLGQRELLNQVTVEKTLATGPQ